MLLILRSKKFFAHKVINVLSILRAAFANFKAGHTVQGGSTITQQLAKIVFLNSQRTIKRKLQEMLLAFELEYKYTKQQILAIYLNRIYLGAGIYGVDAAAKYYFGKNIQDLTISESAIIAGLIRAPSKYAPTNNPTLSGNRAYQVLSSMLDDGYINKAQFDSAASIPVKLNTEMLGRRHRNHFTEWVYEQVPQYVQDNDQDVTVKTTFNSTINQIAVDTLKTQIDQIRETKRVGNGAVVIMDYKGKILAMVGGVDYNKSPFNRATQALRQPGSAFKLFVYVAAVEAGLSPGDEVEDKPLRFKNWQPENYKKQFLGKISLEEAFIYSINTVAVRLAQQIGIDRVIEAAHKMGIKSPLNRDLSLALGTSSVTLLELASAYGSIGNYGYLVEPYGITYIKNSSTGAFIYTKEPEAHTEVISRRSEDIMRRLLLNTVLQGTARQAISDFNISGKTGTSQDFRDAWFCGYTDDKIIGVWLGNDDYTPTKGVSGGTFPTIIARNILRQIEASNPKQSLSPQGW